MLADLAAPLHTIECQTPSRTLYIECRTPFRLLYTSRPGALLLHLRVRALRLALRVRALRLALRLRAHLLLQRRARGLLLLRPRPRSRGVLGLQGNALGRGECLWLPRIGWAVRARRACAGKLQLESNGVPLAFLPALARPGASQLSYLVSRIQASPRGQGAHQVLRELLRLGDALHLLLRLAGRFLLRRNAVRISNLQRPATEKCKARQWPHIRQQRRASNFSSAYSRQSPGLSKFGFRSNRWALSPYHVTNATYF